MGRLARISPTPPSPPSPPPAPPPPAAPLASDTLLLSGPMTPCEPPSSRPPGWCACCPVTCAGMPPDARCARCVAPEGAAPPVLPPCCRRVCWPAGRRKQAQCSLRRVGAHSSPTLWDAPDDQSGAAKARTTRAKPHLQRPPRPWGRRRQQGPASGAGGRRRYPQCRPPATLAWAARSAAPCTDDTRGGLASPAWNRHAASGSTRGTEAVTPAGPAAAHLQLCDCCWLLSVM